ncbi:MAG: exopolysaccharide biosynthesis polyprenyl glycosylphosphotransferase, partial [Lachnospiraceae bacterium]|nr:exopolysaccharide biosynthesis polyprenyl glycosylphosphotransferase [Lachnospiraceae bacterium]
MYRIRDKYKHLLNFSANVATLFFEGVTFAYIWYTYYSATIPVPFYRRGNWAVVGMYSFMVFLITRAMNGYKIGYLRLIDIWLSHILSVVLSAVVGYVLITMINRVYIDPRPLGGMALLQIVFIVPWVFIVRKLYAWLYPPHRTLVVYGDHSPELLLEKMNVHRERYNICKTVSCHENEDKLHEEILRYGAVVLADLPAEERNIILKFCYQNGIRVYVTPKVTDILLASSDDVHLFDTPLLLVRSYGFNITELFFKRIFDVIISLVFIVILSPFMLLVAVAIKLCDGGPVLYKQDRLTRDGKEFMILKFRSMYMDSEKKGGARLAAEKDDRITPVGRIIRRIHFDEVPQLFNIIAGDMSFVGPRPERREIQDKYKEIIPEFDFRLKVKAGLTGYAQVYGKYNTTPYDKLKMDLTYIQNYSPLLDIKII